MNRFENPKSRFKRAVRQSESAVFLDRDGTLTVRPEPTWKRSQLRLQPGAWRAIKIFNQLKLPVIVVTNQGGVIARGLISEKGVGELHDVLHRRLSRSRTHIHAFYFCPHHPQARLKQYRIRCLCRKPNTGLFRSAARVYGINLSKSFMIGDMTRDIIAGKRAGAKTILLKTGHGGRDPVYQDVKPDYFAHTLLDAAKIIKKTLR